LTVRGTVKDGTVKDGNTDGIGYARNPRIGFAVFARFGRSVFEWVLAVGSHPTWKTGLVSRQSRDPLGSVQIEPPDSKTGSLLLAQRPFSGPYLTPGVVLGPCLSRAVNCTRP